MTPVPYYDRDGITIYHGDCREIMPHLRADAMVTDPPFGIGWTRATWDDDPEEYSEMMQWLVQTASEVIRSWCFVFQAMPNIGKFHKWFPDGFRLYAACKNFAQIRPTGVWHSWDPVVFWNNGPNTGPNTRHINRDYHVGNVAVSLRDKKSHPCPKPVDTMRHLAGLAAMKGGTILDPFMGSGTTLVAARDMGRKAIGIEIEERYVKIAVKRLAQGVLY